MTKTTGKTSLLTLQPHEILGLFEQAIVQAIQDSNERVTMTLAYLRTTDMGSR